MKVCLFFEKQKSIKKSGVGRALTHQKQALEKVGIEYTLDYKDDYDVLHINTVFFKSKKVVKWARKHNRAVVYHAHTTEEDFRNSFIFSNQIAPFLKKRLIKLYGSSDVIVTPTVYSEGLLLKYGLKNPIYAISNGIDLTRFKKDAENERIFKEHYNFTNEKIVIAVGLLIKRKGILDFIEVARKMPEYKFIWFGHTPSFLVTRKVKKAIKNRPENVIMAGYVTGEVIQGAFSASDVFFFPSHEETEGIVILEALASSQLIVARDIPVYSPWLKNKVNCYLAQSNEEFIELIKAAAEQKLPHTGAKALELAKERDINLIGAQLEKAYLHAIKINEERKTHSTKK